MRREVVLMSQTEVPPREGPARETHKERLDRELIELLNELRVILPGIQVLFAFLLTVPFSQRFEALSPAQKGAYFAAVLLTAASTAFLITTPSYHRHLFREYEKERLLHLSNALTIAGIVSLAGAMVAVLWLITTMLYDGAAAAAVAVGGAVVLGGLWVLLPVTRRLQRRAGAPAAGAGREHG